MSKQVVFSSGQKINAYCWRIVRGMVSVHGISEHEALLRVAEFCVKGEVSTPRKEDFDMIMHRAVNHWVEGIYFSWNGMERTTTPKPIPSEHYLKSLEVDI